MAALLKMPCVTDDRPALSESIDPDALEAVVREVLVVAGIALLTGLALLVPGAGRELPSSAITVRDFILAVGTMAVVGSLLYSVPRVRDLVSTAIDGPATVVDDVSTVAGFLVAFVAVLVAHWGLAPLVVPLIDGAPWMYDQMFFALAAIVLALIAHRLYRSLDPIAEAVTRELLHGSDSEASSANA